ncbi:MAG: transcription antitermination factor NusB [Puniceicoccales bacterium]|jgi:N utilization substance protein B|nr:transcription antitermination factor NusB [Puniceicoccales bacterium]
MPSEDTAAASSGGLPAKTPNRRRQNRIAAVQNLYGWDIVRPENLAEYMRQFFTTQENRRDYYAFAEELVIGIVGNLEAVDEVIRAHVQNWAFNRIAKIDLAILRLATYELLYRRDIPPVVTINEAIEISKLFSVAESKGFINGILDKIKERLTRPFRESLQE